MKRILKLGVGLWLAAAITLTSALAGTGRDGLISGGALNYFTNVADCLLRTQFDFGVAGIPLHPTNRYDPAVHRLLQLTANVYDASHASRAGEAGPFHPSVFRPRFRNAGGVISIAGYEVVDDLSFRSRPWRDLNNPADRTALEPDDNVYGVPFVIGAKKGHVNFNELSLQTAVQLTRKLKLTRSSLNANIVADNTDSMFIMGVSNVISAESWNSHTSAYPRDLRIEITNLVSFSLTASYVTQAFTTNWSFTLGQTLNVPSNTWPGYGYKIPLHAGFVCLPDMVWGGGLNPPRFVRLGSPFVYERAFVDWQWRLTVSNRLVYIVTDGPRVVDFVNLNDLTAELNLNDIMGTPRTPASGFGRVLFANQWQENARFFEPDFFSSFWQSNRAYSVPAYVGPQGDVTEGVIQQLQASFGFPAISLADWNNWSGRSDSLSEKDAAIDSARKFVGLAPITHYYSTNTWTAGLEIEAPFTPTRKVFHYTSWQVNDPLVHYTAADLVQYTNALLRVSDQALPHLTEFVWPKTWLATNGFLHSLNQRYRPWGPNVINTNQDANTYNLAVKDPLVRSSSDWDFPNDLFLNLTGLGRVHRGTPWQTLYLKSAVADEPAWLAHAGTASNHPTNDWALAGTLVSLLNTNSIGQLFWANETNAAVWAGVLRSLTVISNSDPNTVSIVQSNSPQVAPIVAGINRTRAERPEQYFPRPGDLFATPELSALSPWLDTNLFASRYLTSDAAYEALPAQLLPLLRAGATPAGDVQPTLVFATVGSSGTFTFTLHGEPGRCYRIEASADLRSWCALEMFSHADGPQQFTDPAAGNFHQRFYRAVLLP